MKSFSLLLKPVVALTEVMVFVYTPTLFCTGNFADSAMQRMEHFALQPTPFSPPCTTLILHHLLINDNIPIYINTLDSFIQDVYTTSNMMITTLSIQHHNSTIRHQLHFTISTDHIAHRVRSLMTTHTSTSALSTGRRSALVETHTITHHHQHFSSWGSEQHAISR